MLLMAAIWLSHGNCPIIDSYLVAHSMRGGHQSPWPRALTISQDALAAYGTLLLAVVTLATLITTILISRHGDRMVRAERKEAQALDDLADAYAVQVIGVATTVVMNHGRFTIRDVEARLRTGDSKLVAFEQSERLLHAAGGAALGADTNLNADFQPGILTPWDAGLRFTINPANIANLIGACPILRWTDHRNTRWEHSKGSVKKIPAKEPWA